MTRLGLLAAAGLAFFGAASRADEIVPLAGCYERVYDANWLKTHRGQIIGRVTLSVGKTSMPRTPGETQPILADAQLVMRVGEAAFSTVGACYWERVGLVCNAALSAAETRLCKTLGDGVRGCRLSTSDSGVFELAQKPSGLFLTVRERLELTGSPDGGPFLYLSPDNVENRAFLLQPAPESRCK